MAVLGAAVAGGLFLLSFILWLHEQDIHPLRTVTARIVRRPWFEALLLLFCIGGFVRYGATKGTNGTEDVNRQLQGLMMSSAPVVVPDAVDSTGFSLPADFPPVTNLCFWGIERGEDAVSLGLAWPETWSFAADAVDLFGNWRLATNGWFHLARIDVSSAQSNAVVHLASGDFPTNAMASSAFFQAADQTDSDADGLTDAYERLVSGSSPSVPDSDGDGIVDGDEMSLGTSPTETDSDGDGLSDAEEAGSSAVMPAADTSWLAMISPNNVWSSTLDSDGGSFVVNLPRSYEVNGVTYSQVRICVNGIVHLLNPERPNDWGATDIASPPDLSSFELSTSHVAIAVCCADLCIRGRGWGSMAYCGWTVLPSGYATVIDFYNIGFASERYSSDPHLLSFQLVLPSGEPNVIYLTYRPVDRPEYFVARNPTIGVQCPGLPPARDGERYYNVTWRPSAGSFDALRRIRFVIGKGTDPALSDGDGDGFSDSDELMLFGTDPNVPDGDTDADGLPDATELRIGTDPGLDDTDCDGISDSEEFSIGTNPLQPDTDNDGMNDGWECRHDGAIVERLPTNGLLMAPSGTSVPFDPLVNNDEDSDPNNDSDADPDGDGLTNAEECAMGLNPCRPDTDGDGIDDPTEIGQGSDPSDPSDEGRPGSRVNVSFYFGDHSGSHSEKYRLSVVPVRGQGTRPSSFSWLNERFGECETKTAFLKPGWRYEVRLSHGGTKPNESTDYDYTLRQTGVLPSNVVITDADSLFGVDETSSSFAGAGKVAYIDVLADPLIEVPSVLGVNDDDDNGNGTSDSDEEGEVQDDDDLAEVSVSVLCPEGLSGSVSVMFSGLTTGNLWKDRARHDKVETVDMFSVQGSGVPMTRKYYLEATAASSRFQGELMRVELRVGGATVVGERHLTFIDRVAEPITTERVDGQIANPCCACIGEVTRMRVKVLPADFPDEQICWSVETGAGTFPTSDTGRDVAFLAGGSEGDGIVLRVDCGDCPGRSPKFTLHACQMRTISVFPCAITRIGRVSSISDAHVAALLDEVNVIYRQVGLRFVAGAPLRIVENDVWAQRGLSDKYVRSQIRDILQNTGGLEVYFVPVGSVDNSEDLVLGSHTARGIILRDSANATVLAHEIGHACGWRDIYYSRENNRLSDLFGIERTWLQNDWNNGTGCRFYDPILSQCGLVARLLMLGVDVGSHVDIPSGNVFGFSKSGVASMILLGFQNVPTPNPRSL